MGTDVAVFNTRVARWLDEQTTPWSQLKYTVARANLARHFAPGALDVLDAGGGNGYESIPLATAGHRVTIVDYAAAMLSEANRRATADGVQVQLYQSDLNALPELFPDPAFDLILCHNVLQYVDDLAALLRGIGAALRPGGLLSLISVNRYAMPYREAFFQNDLVAAYAALDKDVESAVLFGTPMREYTADEIVGLLAETGLEPVADYGIRCVCDYWGDNARKSEPTTFAQLERLELALTDRHPYKLLARFFQVVARKL